MNLRRPFACRVIALALALAMPTNAADAETDAKIKALEAQVEALSTQIQDLKVGTASKYAETQKQITAVAPSIVNGRPTLTSADGAFSASLRSLVQFDMGYYDQSAPPLAPQLSNGSNFRRARLGIDGKVYTDWEYSFIYDFGGSGVEGSSISAAYVQYNGLNPVLLRLGAFAPYANIEDSSGSSDLLFLERATVSEIQRGLAGGDGRSAFSVVRAGERFFASLAYTGGRANQSNILDEQQALLGRAAYLVTVLAGFQDRSRHERHVDLLTSRRRIRRRALRSAWVILPNCAWTTPARTARRRISSRPATSTPTRSLSGASTAPATTRTSTRKVVITRSPSTASWRCPKWTSTAGMRRCRGC